MPPPSQSRVPAQRRTAPSKSIEQVVREQQDALAAADEVGADLKEKYGDWFKTLLPGHLPVDAFITMLYGVLRKDPKLTEAARVNMQSFLIAATDCARLGAIPGKEYHFLPFKDEDTHWPTVTGVTDYKLEVRLATQSPDVDWVEVECWYKGDDFAWQPGGAMEFPHHVIKNTDRNPDDLAGVYAYPMFQGRRAGKVIVMWKPEVMTHRAKARSKAVWDGPFRHYMWWKTAIHAGRRVWPQEADKEAAREVAQARAMALGGAMVQLAPDEAPVLVPPKRGQVTDGRPGGGTPAGDTLRTVTADKEAGGGGPGQPDEDPSWAGMGATSKDRPGNGNGNGNGHPVIPGKPEPAGQQGQGQQGQAEADLDGPVTKTTGSTMSQIFQAAGWTGKPAEAAGIDARQRCITACLLATGSTRRPPRIVDTAGQMTEREVRTAINTAEAMRTAASKDGESLADRLQRVYDGWLAQESGNGGGGEAGA